MKNLDIIKITSEEESQISVDLGNPPQIAFLSGTLATIKK